MFAVLQLSAILLVNPPWLTFVARLFPLGLGTEWKRDVFWDQYAIHLCSPDWHFTRCAPSVGSLKSYWAAHCTSRLCEFLSGHHLVKLQVHIDLFTDLPGAVLYNSMCIVLCFLGLVKQPMVNKAIWQCCNVGSVWSDKLNNLIRWKFMFVLLLICHDEMMTLTWVWPSNWAKITLNIKMDLQIAAWEEWWEGGGLAFWGGASALVNFDLRTLYK